MRKFLIVLAVLAVIGGAGAYFLSPLFAFRALAEAAEAGDADALETLVDFPAVREDLKAQLTDRLAGFMGSDSRLARGPFGQLGALLGPTIVEQVVDAAVTPAGVAAIVRSGRAPLSDVGTDGAEPPPPATPPPVAEPAKAEKPARDTSFAYLDLNHFKATTTVEDAPDAPLGWVLERRGPFAWKLVRIELPPA